MPGRDIAENCGGSAFFVLVGDADKMVDVPVVVHAWCYGPDSTVPGQGCCCARCCCDRCSYSARSWTRPLCTTTGVMVQTAQFLDKVVALCPLFSRQVHMVPDVQKTFGGAADAVLRCLGRPCDHAALLAVFMAMLLRVVLELSASAN